MPGQMALDPNIFRAYDIRGTVGGSITPEVIGRIARALAGKLVAEGRPRVVVGRDLRPSSEELCEAAAEGLVQSGCDVIDVGQVPIPLVYFAIGRWECDGGVGVTASHKPAEFNGMKLRVGEYPLYGEELGALRAVAEAGEFREGSGCYERRDIYEEYFEVCAGKFSGDCDLRICLDLGNGCGTFNAPRLLREIGCEVSTLFPEPDGSFPNRPPDPLEPGALERLTAEVKASGADLGMAIDADGDRLAVLDDRGEMISPDKYAIALCGHILESGPATFVSEVRCSQTTIDYVRERGGEVSLAACGYPFILAEMDEVCAALGFETTGHIFFDDPDVKFDDAAFCAANLAQALSGQEASLREMMEEAPRYYTSEEERLECPDEVKFAMVADVVETFRPDHEMNTVDGARISFEGGWGLIRASNTGEELVMRFEGRTEADRDEIAGEIRAAVAEAMMAHGVAKHRRTGQT